MSSTHCDHHHEHCEHGHHDGSCAHEHEHEHEHGEHGHSCGGVATANKEYFDAHAHEQTTNPEFQKLADRLAQLFLEHQRFDKESTDVLDFACGTGLVSRALAPSARSVLGVDISPVSVELYNKASEQAGLAGRVRAVSVELKGDDGEGAAGLLGGASFDVAVCTMAMHHMVSPEAMCRTLAGLLRHGGALLIVDILAREDKADVVGLGSEDAVRAAVPQKHGFEESRVREMFAAAGLKDVSIGSAGDHEIRGHKVNLFIARGVKGN